jgi:hypothetical protein
MLSFFPWVTITERLRFGSFHLVPCAEAIAVGEIPADLAEAVAAVLTSFGHKRAVDQASIPLLRRDGADLVSDLNDEQVREYFEFRTSLAFAALAAREFFGFNYWNSDNLRLVIQGFTPEQAGAALVASRRRDGQSHNLIPKGARRATRPDHVWPGCTLPRDLDTVLLSGLEQARTADNESWPRLAEAIRLFVGANTDSPDVSMHAELVDTVSALSRLFDAWDERATVEGFLAALPPPTESDADRYGPKARTERVQKALEKGLPVRAAWLRDAYVLRSQYGHGRVEEPPYGSIWSEREHLLLGAAIVPLLVKAMLAKDGHYSFTAEDETLNNAFDTLATLEPFAEQGGQSRRYPWRDTINRIRMWPMARELARALKAQHDCDAASGHGESVASAERDHLGTTPGQ